MTSGSFCDDRSQSDNSRSQSFLGNTDSSNLKKNNHRSRSVDGGTTDDKNEDPNNLRQSLTFSEMFADEDRTVDEEDKFDEVMRTESMRLNDMFGS